MKKESFYTIDFFRIVFTIGVIFGHAYCNLYRQTWMLTHTEDRISVHNMCVDAFFIISGIFMAMRIERKMEDPFLIYCRYQIDRVKRLFPPLLFVSCVGILIDVFQYRLESIGQLIRYWPTFFLLTSINNVPGVKGAFWYVSVLFWTGILISALLVFKQKLSKYVIFPLLIIGSFSIMYCKYGTLNLGNNPLIFGALSAGNLRGICGLAVGVELYFISEELKENSFHKCVIAILEISATLGILYCVTRGGAKDNRLFDISLLECSLFDFSGASRGCLQICK